jgi:hypothetical protein
VTVSAAGTARGPGCFRRTPRPPSSLRACFSNPFDAGAIECVDHFHQHIDNAAHRPSLAPIRWMAGKDTPQRGERFLVNAQRARRRI